MHAASKVTGCRDATHPVPAHPVPSHLIPGWSCWGFPCPPAHCPPAEALMRSPGLFLHQIPGRQNSPFFAVSPILSSFISELNENQKDPTSKPNQDARSVGAARMSRTSALSEGQRFGVPHPAVPSHSRLSPWPVHFEQGVLEPQRHPGLGEPGSTCCGCSCASN